MTPMSDVERPWPRFTASSAVRRREVDPAAPWPRWGILLERPSSVVAPTFETLDAPRAAEAAYAAPAADPVTESPSDALDEVTEALRAAEPPEAVEARVIPRPQSTALVPVRHRREVALVDVARAVRRASPVIAVASVAAVAAMAFFRRR
jgi:hypothetical protein